MASAIQRIVSTQLAASTPTLLYTSSLTTWTQIQKLSCINTDAGTHTVSLYIVPSGSSVGAAFLTTMAQAILPGKTFNSPNEYGHVLNPGDALYGFADTGSLVNIVVSGGLFT